VIRAFAADRHSHCRQRGTVEALAGLEIVDHEMNMIDPPAGLQIAHG